MATMSISPTVRPARVSATRSTRLTRRGRLLLTLAIAAFAALGWSGLHATAQADAPMQRIEVKAGETLWSIAERLAPGADPRAMVYELRSINHLDSAQLQPGQILLAR